MWRSSCQCHGRRLFNAMVTMQMSRNFGYHDTTLEVTTIPWNWQSTGQPHEQYNPRMCSHYPPPPHNTINVLQLDIYRHCIISSQDFKMWIYELKGKQIIEFDRLSACLKGPPIAWPGKWSSLRKLTCVQACSRWHRFGVKKCVHLGEDDHLQWLTRMASSGTHACCVWAHLGSVYSAHTYIPHFLSLGRFTHSFSIACLLASLCPCPST